MRLDSDWTGSNGFWFGDCFERSDFISEELPSFMRWDAVRGWRDGAAQQIHSYYSFFWLSPSQVVQVSRCPVQFYSMLIAVAPTVATARAFGSDSFWDMKVDQKRKNNGAVQCVHTIQYSRLILLVFHKFPRSGDLDTG